MTPKKQVSPAIRILRGERDASARATHLEAATRKFLVTTNERKQMSTKTNFKRIALVAVAALGMGVLSSAPSQAAFNGAVGSQITISTAAGTAGLSGAKSDSTTAGSISVSALALLGTDSFTVTVVGKSKPSTQAAFPAVNLMLADTATSTGKTSVSKQTVGATSWAGQITAPYGAGDTATTMGVAPEAAATTNTYVAAKFLAYMDSASSTRVAGTYVYSVIVTPYAVSTAVTNGTQTADLTFTIAEAATASETVDSSKSTAFLGAAVNPTADAAISALATASSTTAAYLAVRTYNAASGAAGESITVSIAGAGQLYHTATGVGGTSIKVKSAGGTDGNFEVRPDGRAGVATISVSTTSTTFSSKTVNFYAAAAKTITATVGTPLLAVGANTGAVRGVAVDANGVAWTGQAYIVASSATDALVGGSATAPVACAAYDTINARHNCPITTLTTGTAKFKIIDAATVAAATATSNEVTVTVSAALPATVKLEFDKATYAPNERARIYITPLDSTGKAMQSAAYTSMLASGGVTVIGAVSYTGTTTTQDSLTAATAFTTAAQSSSTSGAKAGSMQFTVYMPAAGGTVTLSATGGTALPVAGQVALTATATVTDSGAAALAAVTALATTVASLKTLITTLTNLVLKIQKKVKA
jgi:hypothetical protein